MKMLMKKLAISGGAILFIGGALVTGRLYSKVQALKSSQPQIAGIATEAHQNVPSDISSAPQALTADTNNQLPTPTVDPDPIVQCTMNANCGGGVKLLKASVCGQSVCCEVGSTWSLYGSKESCSQAQNAYFQATYVAPPTIKPTYPPCVLYYPVTKTYSTYYGLSPADCLSWQNGIPNPMPTTDPNIAKNAQDQFNQINNNMQNLTPSNTQYITGTPVPCSSLQGQANIIGGGCQ